MRGKIICELEKCLGCRNCQIACAMSHSNAKSLTEAILLDTLPYYRLNIESEKEGSTPNLCRHCNNAPCVAACKFDALLKEGPGEPVLLKIDLCKGCRKCVKECPFGVLRMVGEGKNKKVAKCDFCIERLKKGEEPACVVACPTRALRFVKAEELEKVGAVVSNDPGFLVEVIERGSER